MESASISEDLYRSVRCYLLGALAATTAYAGGSAIVEALTHEKANTPPPAQTVHLVPPLPQPPYSSGQ